MLIAIFLIIIFFIAGIVQGLSGFGSALIAIPLLSFFIDIKIAVPLCILNSIIITTLLTRQLKEFIDRKKITPLCISCIPGIIIGTFALKNIPSEIMCFVLGFLLTTYSIYVLLNTPKQRRLHRFWAYAAGFFTGAIAAAFSAGGPPTIIYASLNNWTKNQIKATLSVFFLFNSYSTMIAHTLNGIITETILYYFAISAPAVFIGTIVGSKYYDKLSSKNYLRLIYIFLLLMGLSMMTL